MLTVFIIIILYYRRRRWSFHEIDEALGQIDKSLTSSLLSLSIISTHNLRSRHLEGWFCATVVPLMRFIIHLVKIQVQSLDIVSALSSYNFQLPFYYFWWNAIVQMWRRGWYMVRYICLCPHRRNIVRCAIVQIGRRGWYIVDIYAFVHTDGT